MSKQSPTTEDDKRRTEYFSILISELRNCNPAFNRQVAVKHLLFCNMFLIILKTFQTKQKQAIPKNTLQVGEKSGNIFRVTRYLRKVIPMTTRFHLQLITLTTDLRSICSILITYTVTVLTASMLSNVVL